MATRSARLRLLLALAVPATPLAAAPGPPPVLATKALRVELPGTADALWRFVPRSGAPAQAFAAPVFPLDGRPVTASLAGVSRVGDPVVLPNGVFEHVFRGTLRDDPSLGLEIRFRLSEDGPILRFAYRLTSTRPRAFARSSDEDALVYLRTSLAGLPRAREVRLSEFVELFHSYTLSERDVPESHFEAGLEAMGPILAASDGKRTLLLAYEHGSQAPDAFVRFDLAPGRRVTLRAVKGSYWRGLTVDSGHPYDTVWMQAGLVAGDLDWTAEAYRTFVRNELSQNPETRAPRVHYNTWNFQERNKHWNGKPYLESMNAARMLAEIDVAARMGIETFVLDTGWYEKTGDWAVSRARFPEGLGPLKAKLDAHGMRLGLWFNPTAAAVSSRVGLAHAAHRMSWKGESKARPVWETEESYPMCLVSPWGEAFLEELVRLHRETGVTYYKWDAVGQYGCDAPGHGHGTADNTPEERADAYAFRIGLRLAEIAERLAEQVPGAVVDFDVTEGGRAVGLAFLTAGRYFLVNNGPYYQDYDVPIDPEKDNWNLFFHKGPARTWITRSTYGYDKWIPAELFLTHYFPDEPEEDQVVGIASMILGHNGIWGDLLSLSPEGVARFGTLLGLWRQVRDSIAVASPVRHGAVGGSGEVHEKIEHETGRGAIVLFSTASGRQKYVSEHPVVREHWATPGTTVTFDARGRAIVEAAFEKPGAAIVFFGVRPGEKQSRAQSAAGGAWPEARPADLGLRPEVLDGELTELLGANKTGAALLAVKGKLVWEHYWNGFGPSSRFDVYSAGKAYAATAIGVLMDEGKLRVDDPACLYLTEWAGDDRRNITIRHLLTMTSGLKLDYEGFTVTENPTAATLGWPLERPPGTAWSYEQATAHAVGLIVQRVTGQQPIVFLRERILNPIGAVETDWLRSRQGDCLAWRSVLTSAREFALFGQLYLNEGRWNGRQLVSEGFIRQATVNDPLLARVPTAPGQDDFRRRGYGWLMFVNTNGIWEGVDRRGFGFPGAFHNICLVDPSRELVFVRMVTPEEQKNHKDYENALDVTDQGTAKIWRTVLSAFGR